MELKIIGLAVTLVCGAAICYIIYELLSVA